MLDEPATGKFLKSTNKFSVEINIVSYITTDKSNNSRRRNCRHSIITFNSRLEPVRCGYLVIRYGYI